MRRQFDSKLWGRMVLVVICLGPLLGLLGPQSHGPADAFVFWQLRVPRVIAGLLVGGTLGLAGAVTQALFRNPLATPSTTGALAGATVGALVALVFGAGATALGLSAVALAAFAGAMLTSSLVLLASANGQIRTQDILLIGIAVTLAATSAATIVEDLADTPALVAASRWSLGHLSQVGFAQTRVVAPIFVLCWAVQLTQIRSLQTLVLGEDVAHARGVSVRRVRFVSLGASSLSVAAAVAWCGPIAFVGLIVPALVRLALGANQRVVLPGSLIAGAAFLSLCDALGRLVTTHHEIPVGVVTAALGAPALVLLVTLRNRRS
jgi:ABC-type Fe3+-siderophore transport system permease subunit